MKLSARRKYDYRELDKIEAKHNSYASDVLFGGRDRRSLGDTSLKERALTRHLRAFGRRILQYVQANSERGDLPLILRLALILRVNGFFGLEQWK